MVLLAAKEVDLHPKLVRSVDSVKWMVADIPRISGNSDMMPSNVDMASSELHLWEVARPSESGDDVGLLRFAVRRVRWASTERAVLAASV